MAAVDPVPQSNASDNPLAPWAAAWDSLFQVQQRWWAQWSEGIQLWTSWWLTPQAPLVPPDLSEVAEQGLRTASETAAEGVNEAMDQLPTLQATMTAPARTRGQPRPH